MSLPLPFPPIAEIVAAVHADPRRAGEQVEESLNRLEGVGQALGAVLTMGHDRARAGVAALVERLKAGEKPPLAGVPVAIKDNICTKGLRTTCASRMLESFVPPYDATVVSRLEAAGAIIVCKTNLDEFAMGSSNENSAFGPVHNPWGRERAPGGSSGGSAAVVAAGLVPAALGSDTGGSIRQPAAFCGTVGVKPTYGRVSRYGLVAFGSSLDQVGPFTRTVEDASAILAVLAGRDERDATSAAEPVASAAVNAPSDLKGRRIGLVAEALGEGIDEDVAARCREAAASLEARGASVVEVSLPHLKYAIPAYYIVATSEASSNLARFDGIHYGRRSPNAKTVEDAFAKSRAEGFGAEVKRRIMLGTYALSAGHYDAYYERAMRVRTLLLQDHERAFEHVDALLTPVTPSPAFRLGERTTDPLAMYAADILTAAANLAGLPAIAVPQGFVEREGEELPVGLQLTGPAFSEPELFALGRALEGEQPELSPLPQWPATDSETV